MTHDFLKDQLLKAGLIDPARQKKPAVKSAKMRIRKLQKRKKKLSAPGEVKVDES